MSEKSSLQISEDIAASVAKTENRVTLQDVEAAIDGVEFIHPNSAPHFTLAFVKLGNGYIVTGQSAPADPANFDAEAGKKFALEDAKRKIWGLEGYLLCEKISIAKAA